MPTNITIIRTEDFIRPTPDGTLDIETSRKLLTDLVAASNMTGANHVLIDTRGANPGLSKQELFQLGAAVATQRVLAGGRIALLVPLDKRADAEFFEAVARLQGADGFRRLRSCRHMAHHATERRALSINAGCLPSQ